MNKWFVSLFIFLFLLFFFAHRLQPAYADGTYAGIGTADAADGGPDAINFSQGRVWTIDKYGKYIWMTEDRGTNHHWAWSNDNGANWTQGSESYGFLDRGSIAYDSVNDILHVIWVAQDSSSGGGVIYRRYSITRDGSNNITSIQRVDTGVNLQLDYTDASATTEEPVALWVNDGSTYGELIAVWAKNGMTSSRGEVRASMRKLSNTNADGTGSNWVAIDGSAATFSVDAPQIPADKIYSSTSTTVVPAAIVRGGTGAKKNDIYIFVAVSASSNSNLYSYRGAWNSSSTDWSNGIQSPVTVGSINNQAGGYNQKQQLVTRPVLDSTNDRLYVGWARWKDNSSGDTWSFAYLDSSDTPSATFDAYSANGTHSYAPTGDIAFDATTGYIYTSYVESTTNGTNGSIDYKTFDGTTLGSQTRFYTNSSGSAGADGGADIPIMYDNRQNSRMLFAFRINGSLPPTSGDPHKIDFGYITPITPTSTPTPTSTATPTPTNASSGQTNSSSNSTNNSSTSVPTCTATKPSGTPDLFQIDAGANQVILYFAPASGSVSSYYISYGYTSGDQRFGVSLNQGSSSGVLSYTINELSPSAIYYFRIRAGNGCSTGDWGNEMKITTIKKGSSAGRRYYKNLLSEILSIFPKQITKLTSAPTPTSSIKPVAIGTSCQYIVIAGDSLWHIAKSILGHGSRYSDIVKQNNLNSTIIVPGQKLNVGC